MPPTLNRLMSFSTWLLKKTILPSGSIEESRTVISWATFRLSERVWNTLSTHCRAGRLLLCWARMEREKSRKKVKRRIFIGGTFGNHKYGPVNLRRKMKFISIKLPVSHGQWILYGRPDSVTSG